VGNVTVGAIAVSVVPDARVTSACLWPCLASTAGTAPDRVALVRVMDGPVLPVRGAGGSGRVDLDRPRTRKRASSSMPTTTTPRVPIRARLTAFGLVITRMPEDQLIETADDGRLRPATPTSRTATPGSR
jgi:hypothetical protein